MIDTYEEDSLERDPNLHSHCCQVMNWHRLKHQKHLNMWWKKNMKIKFPSGYVHSLVITPFRICSTRFLTLPRRFSNFDVSIDAARLRTDLPGFASGLSIHHDDLPVPSFCTLMNRLCSDKLWRMEFYITIRCNKKKVRDE